MPKIGMEGTRRRDLIAAVIATIHDRGAEGMTMQEVARRAGVSAGLAHHYFGGKQDLLVATMRHLLTELGEGARRRLRAAETPDARVRAIIAANLAPEQCTPEVISAWLAFYDRAQTDPQARRLLEVYARRLDSNLAEALSKLMPREAAQSVADGIAALIDGIWLRAALGYGPQSPDAAIALVEDHYDAMLARHGAAE